MRRWWAVMVLAALLGLGFGATWWFLKSPQYALYQIGKAIHDHEPRLFLAYVDLDRVMDSQKEELARLILPQENQEARQVVSRLLGAVMGALRGRIRQRVAQMVADPERDNLPSSWALVAAAHVTRNGDYALVVLSDPQKGRRLRLGMQRDPRQGHWRVVEIDPRDLRQLLEELLKES